jgi:hypothetical protein
MTACATIRPRRYVSARTLARLLREPLRMSGKAARQAIRLAAQVRFNRFDS